MRHSYGHAPHAGTLRACVSIEVLPQERSAKTTACRESWHQRFLHSIANTTSDGVTPDKQTTVAETEEIRLGELKRKLILSLIFSGSVEHHEKAQFATDSLTALKISTLARREV